MGQFHTEMYMLGYGKLQKGNDSRGQEQDVKDTVYVNCKGGQFQFKKVKILKFMCI